MSGLRLDSLAAPAMLTWQLTKDCDLACVHCLTESAPGRALPHEFSRAQALSLAKQVVASKVPYVMLAGGEPTIVPYFLELAEFLGNAGVMLKIETNGQTFSEPLAERLAKLPVRSIQISLDGDTQAVYGKMRPGGSLDKAWDACRKVTAKGMPLEVTFAPTRINLAETGGVIDRAASLGAFRFNTGMLMRLGTAAKLWDRLSLHMLEADELLKTLVRKEREYAGRMELCFRPLDLVEDLQSQLSAPSGTLLVLPDGRVKVAGPLPFTCADLKTQTLAEAWAAYRRAWARPEVAEAARRVVADPSRIAEANRWTALSEEMVTAGTN